MKKIFLIITLSIFLLTLVSSAEVSYCCERTESGMWCQNAPQQNCDSSYRITPTACESTSYCKKGCCYNSQEGTCMENSPQKNCEEQGGVWEGTATCEIPQCELGCCLIGNQASFVTLTRCKRLASIYGLEINFRVDISNEIQCIATATSDVKGACVFEKEFEKTCRMTTQAECKALESKEQNVKFHKGYLCSAETLGTTCGPTKRTTCIEGEDEIYFLDSCGNLANIYDASKIESKEYWSKIYRKDESCGTNDPNGNAESKTCGNCDYYLGSTCKSYQRGETNKPTYGNNICKDLSCTYQGKKYKHGETWCAQSKGVDESLPGSRHFRLACYNGEVTVEPCADYRQETCIESDIDGFSTAACRVNMWQDCLSQDEKKDCENKDRRDCKWIGGEEDIKCVPSSAPGFNFWETESDAESLCTTASVKCIVKYEKGLLGGEDCVENCHCLSQSWKNRMNEMCTSIGDCGTTTNYIGIQGYNEKNN